MGVHSECPCDKSHIDYRSIHKRAKVPRVSPRSSAAFAVTPRLPSKCDGVDLRRPRADIGVRPRRGRELLLAEIWRLFIPVAGSLSTALHWFPEITPAKCSRARPIEKFAGTGYLVRTVPLARMESLRQGGEKAWVELAGWVGFAGVFSKRDANPIRAPTVLIRPLAFSVASSAPAAQRHCSAAIRVPRSRCLSGNL